MKVRRRTKLDKQQHQPVVVKKKNKNRSVHFYEGLEDYVQELADKNKRCFNNQINVIIEEHKEKN